MIVTGLVYTYTDPLFVGALWHLRCDEDGAWLYVKSRARTLKAAIYLARRRVLDLPVTISGAGAYKSTTSFAPAYSGLDACWVFEVSIMGAMPETGCYAARVRIK